jgi:cytochrome c biogenesis protein ResB
VTVFRGARAGPLIFSTLWFNALLVLLAISSATAFFSRIWRRKLTLVSAGMILFHLCFAAMLGGIAWNRLFFFEGLLRMTEGETLPNGRLESYDRFVKGRFFDVARLRGETTLLKMHRDFKVEGANKRAAYEIAIDDGATRSRSVIYVAEYLDFEGVRFFCSMEGYSLLLVIADEEGRERFGAFVPLQSLKQRDGTVLYASAKKMDAPPFPFPPPPAPPLAGVQLGFRPNTVADRAGDVTIEVWGVGPNGELLEASRKGTVAVGQPFDAGDYALTAREVRYWVGMNVRYDPGLPVVLSSLCLGLAGMALTFVGRVRQGGARRRAA